MGEHKDRRPTDDEVALLLANLNPNLPNPEQIDAQPDFSELPDAVDELEKKMDEMRIKDESSNDTEELTTKQRAEQRALMALRVFDAESASKDIDDKFGVKNALRDFYRYQQE